MELRCYETEVDSDIKMYIMSPTATTKKITENIF